VGTQKLETTLSGTPLDIEATGVNCIGCVIKNVGTAATIEGKLEFTGVAVSAPMCCNVSGGTIVTNALTAVLGMNTAGTIATLKYTPQSGSTLATFGLSCPTGLYKLSGSILCPGNQHDRDFRGQSGIQLQQSDRGIGRRSHLVEIRRESRVPHGRLQSQHRRNGMGQQGKIAT
jgi:hypothetical protein